MIREPVAAALQTCDAVLERATLALAESHARWCGGATVQPEDFAAHVSPMRRYEAGYVVRALEADRASSGWVRVAKALPPPHVSVMVRMELVGPVYDVAVYTGRNPAGEHRWILADVALDHSLITHWSLVHEPEDCLP